MTAVCAERLLPDRYNNPMRHLSAAGPERDTVRYTLSVPATAQQTTTSMDLYCRLCRSKNHISRGGGSSNSTVIITDNNKVINAAATADSDSNNHHVICSSNSPSPNNTSCPRHHNDSHYQHCTKSPLKARSITSPPPPPPGGVLCKSREGTRLPAAAAVLACRIPVWRWCHWERWGCQPPLWTMVCTSFVFLFLLNQPMASEALPAAAAAPQHYGGGGRYGNNHYSNHYNHGHHNNMAGDEEYDEPEVFRLRGRPVTDTAYLTTFGYLPQSDFETGAMRTEEEMSRAIRRFQQFANLPLSGTFDEKTRAQMARPRCGLPDIIPTKRDSVPSRRSRGTIPEVGKGVAPAANRRHHRLRHQHGGVGASHSRAKRYELSDAKWETTQLTYRILNHSPDLAQTDVRRALYRALKLWSDVTHLNFREKISGDADIMIRFAAGYHGDGYSFDGPGLILAHAFFPGPDRGGDVHFDEDEHWTAGTTEGTNLFIVAAHEIGHALGLSHSPVPGSLMFPWYQGYVPNYRLPQDDIDGIQAFYGVKTPPILPPEPGDGGSQPRPQPPLPTPSTTTLQPVTRRPWTTTTPLPTPPSGDTPPDSCNAVIDAISIVRGEIFAFSGKWFWRVDGDGVMKDYPVEINRFWYGFPSYVDRIDAVYEQFGGKIIFFRGSRYWTFNGNRMVPNFPKDGRPLSDLGLPTDLTHVDAAFQWGYNKMVYIISGFNYWRFNVHENKVEADYPRDMSMWQGVPLPVGSAFKFWDGRTYFFQGTQTWCFNDARMAVRDAWPKHTGETFLDCKRQMKQGFEADNPDMVTGAASTSISSPSQHIISKTLATATSLLIVLVLAS